MLERGYCRSSCCFTIAVQMCYTLKIKRDEVRSLIKFLLTYGNNVITERGVRQWCMRFKNGRTNVHDDEQSGWPSIVTDEIVSKVDEKFEEDCRFTTTELSHSFPQLSRSS
ncbi:hypothetical protein J6590_028710 [Homalodisca vitripennis]|nr:hypothetical protein J6590_028710 [Homalodisca vitripennis]